MTTGIAAALVAVSCVRPPGGPAPSTPPVEGYDAIYFVLVDRFHNGDPRNDEDADPSDPTAFHGGDLQGVIDRLDHLEALGVRTVWLSPVFEMRDAPFFGHGAFHGYWVRDPSAVEPRFGDEATLKALADALHARGMALVLDLVWNHVSFDSPLVAAHPDWFHEPVPITDWDDPVQLVTHQVHGLPDLAQERPEVRAWLLDASKGWIDRVGVDGFRIDAVRHMPLDVQREMVGALREHAGGDLWTVGEVFDGDPVRLSASWEGGGFDSVFDFPLRYAMIDTFCRGRSLGRLGAVLSADRAYADPNRLVTFLDNHDVARVTTECGGDLDRVREALAFLFLVRGIPSITWATEIAAEGAQEPENRPDMRFDGEMPLRDAIVAGLDRRRRHPSLVAGRSALVWVADDLLVLRRVHPEETATIAVNRRGEAVTVRGIPVPADPISVSFGPGGTWADPGERTVRITATGVPADADGRVVVVGTGRTLGAWRPEAGVPMEEGGPAWHASLAVPGDSALEFKLVVRGPDGDVWQAGENRTVFVPAGEAPLEVAVSW